MYQGNGDNMKKNLVVVLLLMIMCVGCEANYSLEISKDLTVKETLQATEDREFFNQYEKSSMGRVVGFILSPYLNILNENNYETNNYITTNRGGVVINKEYKTFDEYTKSTTLTSQFTNKIDYKEDGDLITITTNGGFSVAEQDQQRIPIEKASISINVPFKVEEHNADKVSDNVYTWIFDDSDTNQREIKLVFDKSKINKKINYVGIFTIISVIILLLLVFMMYNNVRKKRESINKI